MPFSGRSRFGIGSLHATVVTGSCPRRNARLPLRFFALRVRRSPEIAFTHARSAAGHASRLSSRDVPLPATVRNFRRLAGQVQYPAALMGFVPFAVLFLLAGELMFPSLAPTCRFVNVLLDAFSSRDRPPNSSHPHSWRTVDQGRSPRLLGFIPASNPHSADNCVSAGRDCLGICLFQVFGRIFAHDDGLVPVCRHQPRETASGSDPLVGFSGELRDVKAKQLPWTSLPSPTLQRLQGADA
jgi:hypothetical protein